MSKTNNNSKYLGRKFIKRGKNIKHVKNKISRSRSLVKPTSINHGVY